MHLLRTLREWPAEWPLPQLWRRASAKAKTH